MKSQEADLLEREEVRGFDWNHHCLDFGCGYMWNSNELSGACPKCGCDEFETITFIAELERWNCGYPGEWAEALKLLEKIKKGECQEVTEEEIETLYEEMLDDCYSVITLCGCEYSPSFVLKNVDEVLYRMGLAEYEDQNWKEHPYRSGYWITKED